MVHTTYRVDIRNKVDGKHEQQGRYKKQGTYIHWRQFEVVDQKIR